MKKPKNIADKTGVYIFSLKKKPLYVGRALSLKRRVSNYFQKGLDSRIEEMVSLADSLRFIETDSILDSVILEANLIKEYWPKYNVKDKDNRSFSYIVIDNAEYPKPIIVRGSDLKKISSPNTFGPFKSQKITKTILQIIRRIFPYSTCLPVGKAGLPSRQRDKAGKPCFNYQLRLCPGICINEISKVDYMKNIINLKLFLRGEKKRLLKKLIKEEPNKANSLKHIQDVTLIQQSDDNTDKAHVSRIEGYDISHLSGDYSYGAMVVFVNGKPDKSQYRLFKVNSAPDDLRSLEEIITRRFKHKEWPFPNLIMIDGGKPQIDFISNVMAKENISIPLVGISKYAGDKLVFPAKTSKALKELIGSSKGVLLKAREEAHRFSLKSNRRKRKL